MMQPTASEPWDDDRLTAAFAAGATRHPTPIDLADRTRSALRTAPPSTPLWRRLVAPAAVLVLAVGTAIGGYALLGGDRGAAGLVEFRDGPASDLRTLDAQEFALEYPSAWLAYDATAAFSGGSSIAVLGTQPVETRCGDARHVDINCVFEQPLEPGDIRVYVGAGSYRGGTVLDRADIENGTTTRGAVAGMPAILDEFDPQPDSYYKEDLSLRWSIGRPATITNVVTIELRAREASVQGTLSIVAEARAALDAMIKSFRFDVAPTPSGSPVPPSTPTPSGPEQVLGLPILTVVEAIAARDAGVDDREIAVRGWHAPYYPARACGKATLEQPVSPLQLGCIDQMRWLMQDPEPIITVGAGGISWRAPDGPAIKPYLGEIDPSWAASDDVARLVELVVIGHFDDRRSFACPATEVDACRDRFVVDRVVSADGRSVPTSALDLVAGGAASTEAEAEATVRGIDPGAEILSMIAVDGELGLQLIEPSIGVFARLQDQRAIWVVRVLENGILGTHLVVDGTDAIFKVDADNVATQMSGTLPIPSVPREVFGLEVIDVEAALAIQARPDDDREIAIAGWYRPNRSIDDCLVPRSPPSPLYANCNAYNHLATQPVSLGNDDANLPFVIYPASWYADVDPTKPMVLIGHFDDRRASACASAPGETCADVFWVDSLWVDGALVNADWSTSTSDEPNPRGSHDAAWSVASSSREGELLRLSVGRITSTDLRTLEPILDLQAKPLRGDALVQESWVWHVTGLESDTGRVRTLVIPDSVFSSPEGSSTYEINGQQVTIRTTIVD